MKQHRDRYYDLLNFVRHSGDWEEWLAFFLEGVRVTATAAVDAAQQISHMLAYLLRVIRCDSRKTTTVSKRPDAGLVRLCACMKRSKRVRLMLHLSEVCRRTTLSFPTLWTTQPKLH